MQHPSSESIDTSSPITQFNPSLYLMEVIMKRISILLLVFCTCFTLAGRRERSG